jgi:hypothetical protein
MEAWLGGERLEVETLLAEYPSLADAEKLLALVCNEVALREAIGEIPRKAEYQARFPKIEDKLRSRYFAAEEQSINQRVVAPKPSKPVAVVPPPKPPSPRPVADTPLPEATRRGVPEAPAAPVVRPAAAPTPVPEATRIDTAPVVPPNAIQAMPPGAIQAAPPPAPRSERQQLPGYEILSELGRGGMGVVYKARQLSLNRPVALKMILSGGHASADDLARFRLEADAVGQLKHPNIVQIFDIGEHDGKPYFSLEFVEGGTLERKLDRSTLTGQQAAEVVEALARAMQTAHEKGIIHRDLKPGNVLMTRDGVPKITDFGLAKQLHSDSARTQSGSVLGTPSFMAPEQAEGRLAEISYATDVYALGAILYCTLTGRPPFKGATAVETMHQVVHEEPLPPSRLQPKVSRDLETICLKCLEKQPRKRYASAADLADDLRRYLNGEPIHARSMGRTERAWRWCRRNPVPAALLVTVILGAAFGMWYLSHLSQQELRNAALFSAAQQADMFEQLNDFYSDEIVKRSGLRTTWDYKNQPRTLPAPATLQIDLGQFVSDHSQEGLQIHVYSDYPFKNRTERGEGGPRDEFEKEALQRLRENPDKPFYRFEDLKGQPVLRYAKARVLKESCVDCHNNHELSPKHDWKVGDVRGVFEIVRPLEGEQEKTRSGRHGLFVLVGGFVGALVVFAVLAILLGRRARRPA